MLVKTFAGWNKCLKKRESADSELPNLKLLMGQSKSAGLQNHPNLKNCFAKFVSGRDLLIEIQKYVKSLAVFWMSVISTAHLDERDQPTLDERDLYRSLQPISSDHHDHNFSQVKTLKLWDFCIAAALKWSHEVSWDLKPSKRWFLPRIFKFAGFLVEQPYKARAKLTSQFKETVSFQNLPLQPG